MVFESKGAKKCKECVNTIKVALAESDSSNVKKLQGSKTRSKEKEEDWMKKVAKGIEI